jgi:hypothetical protein
MRGVSRWGSSWTGKELPFRTLARHDRKMEIKIWLNLLIYKIQVSPFIILKI